MRLLKKSKTVMYNFDMSEKVVKKTKRRKINSKITGKLISIGLIVIAIVLLTNVFKQVRLLYTLKKQSELVESELTALEDENAALVSTKTKLEDPNYVTTYARGAYMFSRGDEKVFYLPSSSSSSNSDSEASSE